MPTKHLKTGDALPPLEPGVVRLFSMRFCPFASRPRLVAKAKGIEFDEVNCNLSDKPEWLLERNPGGKVPVFEKDGHVIYESIIVSDMLDAMLPNKNPLYPSDPIEKARHQLITTVFGNNVIPAFYKAWRNPDDNEIFNELVKKLENHEQVLSEFKTPFIFGERPGMVDLMCFPFYERITMITERKDELLKKFPNFAKHLENLLKDPVVKAVANDPKLLRDFYITYREGVSDYNLADVGL